MSQLPFDPSGDLRANRFLNEPHTVTAVNGVDHNYLVPVNAPFYNDSMTVVNAGTGEALVENEDFYFGYSFQEATEETGKAVSGAVVLIDPNRTGTFYLNYQSLGGEYVNDQSRAIEDGLQTLQDLNGRDWSDITDVPAVFPPTPHKLRLDEVAGVAEIVAQLNSIEAAMRDAPRKITTGDIADLDTTYIQPLLDKLGAVAQEISLINERTVHYFQEANNTHLESDLTDVLSGSWTDVGVSVTVGHTGAYSLQVSGNPHAVNADGAVPVAMRFVVNGQPVSQSRLNSTLLGLTLEDVVAVEVAPMGGNADVLSANGPTYGCGLTLLKVSD